ncbi:MAG: glycosyltransferase, partial [Chloroflexi bacterium]|nr:glycosyltransferase [Chloroflexota bacterium]
PPAVACWPRVAVQLPIYNERYVVTRLLNAVAALNYPRDRLVVQVLDDSTDETTAIVATQIAPLRAAGLDIRHVRRPDRAGFKAGALAHGLRELDVAFVAIFDADFIPPPDFLRCTVAHLLTNPQMGVVQTRWGHLNSGDNLLTAVQTLALDGHFVVEQPARQRAGWLLNFSGSGGVWRTCAIKAAGGWQADTLTEDLDLSYRAQLAGWQIGYLPDVVVPGELPTQLAAYKQQQARWAQGGTQCLLKLAGPVWRCPRLTLPQRIMATLHLSQYLPHLLIMLLVLLTPLLLATGALPRLALGPLGALGILGVGPPLLLITAQAVTTPHWLPRSLALPALIVLATGLALSNTRAILSALAGQRTAFRRTPKFAQGGRVSGYRLPADTLIVWELVLCGYALWGALTALTVAPALVPLLALHCAAFGLVLLWDLRELWELRR